MAEMARVSDRLRGVAAFLSSSAWGYNVDVLKEAAAELDRREARLTALEQALRKYGKHQTLCATCYEADYNCSCGLAAALKG